MHISSSSSPHSYIRFTGGTYRRFQDRAISGQSNATSANNHTTHGSYGALLLDPRWKVRRQQILARDQHQCVICHCSQHLQIHHRQYHFQQASQQFNSPWDYEDALMITLCERCHKKGHQRYEVPTITI